MTDSGIIFGKHVLESLSIGMYSDPLTIYREYVQNSTDSLEEAIRQGIIDKDSALINIKIDDQNRSISIRDNGVGVKADIAFNILLDIANSQKDYRSTRGFRGIGRLGALGCSKRLIFITSSKGEKIKSKVTWDCETLLKLLSRDNNEAKTALEVMQKVISFSQEEDEENSHYFEVILDNVFSAYEELLNKQVVETYLCTVAPIPFDAQLFSHSTKIHKQARELGLNIDEFNIIINGHQKPLYKKYKNSISTGNISNNKKTDYVSDIEFFFEKDKNDKILFFGWYGITSFYGSISDNEICGLRLRKGNILIGDKTTCNKFFKSEGERANFWFLGEIYVFDENLIPNAKRDDFERNSSYDQFEKLISKKANELNKNYRRLMSEYHSTVRTIKELTGKIEEIKELVSATGVTSDTQRDKFLVQHEADQKKLADKTKELNKVLARPNLAHHYIEQVEEIVENAEKAKSQQAEIENLIIDSDYSTKLDLNSSFSKEQRKIYQKIIEVIDAFFEEDKKTANDLRAKIIENLNKK